MDSDSESSESSCTIMEKRQVIQIDLLPDDVLLQIFYIYVHMGSGYEEESLWQTLVHVCGRWRYLVFQSPRRLDLHLYCSTNAPAKDKLDIWPALPLIVEGEVRSSTSTDNVIAVLEQANRVRQVALLNIDIPGGQFEKLLAAMQVSFPELTRMYLSSYDKTIPVIPDSFLGGSASSLVYFDLDGIPFPGLPKLLLSANHLDTLSLTNIPHSGYISPEAIASLLSALPNLISLWLKFRSPQSCPDWRSRSLRPPKRSILPLRALRFKGVTEYLEELLARIDTPRLEIMEITYFNQIDFDCPRLAQFFNCTPILSSLDEAHVGFHDSTASVNFRSRTSSRDYLGDPWIKISCRELDWQLSFIGQICNSCLPSPSTIEDLYISRPSRQRVWKIDAIENTLWLQLLLPFTAVKNLYISEELAPGIAAALQELVGGRNTEVLPSLESLFVGGLRLEPSTFLDELEVSKFLHKDALKASTFLHNDALKVSTILQNDGFEASRSLQENIWRFVVARQLSNPDHPITISNWNG